MNRPKHPILIGCSGWSYPDWEGPFYPEGMAAGDYLEWYADRFPIVEVDSTFYRPPTAADGPGWRDRTPDGFRFALKVPQAITHQKQLRDCEEEVDGFVSSILPLGDKLTVGPPPTGLLQPGGVRGARRLPRRARPVPRTDWPHEEVPLAVEVRNPRWVGPELCRSSATTRPRSP